MALALAQTYTHTYYKHSTRMRTRNTLTYSDSSVGGMLKRKSVLREKRLKNKIKAARKV